jgi:hypothetical protein
MINVNLKKYKSIDCSPSILVVFKYSQRWNEHVIKILQKKFNVYVFFFSEVYENYNTLQIVDYIKRKHKEIGFECFLIDPEWCDIFNVGSIEYVEDILPVGLMFFDDSTMHDYNRILACKSSFVLSGCPLSVLKYREMGLIAHQFSPICDDLYLSDNGSHRKDFDYDVFWFGYINKSDRPMYIDALRVLSDKLKINIYGGEVKNGIVMSGELSYVELGDLIRSSKLTINLCKSDFPFRCWAYTSYPRAEQYIFTGRPIEIGLSGGYCISQYSPQYEIDGFMNFMPTFENPLQMSEVIINEINRDNFLENRNSFIEFIKGKFSSGVLVENFSNAIFNAKNMKYRPVSRVSQVYVNVAAGAILNSNLGEDRKKLEIKILMDAVEKVKLDFDSSKIGLSRRCDNHLDVTRIKL